MPDATGMGNGASPPAVATESAYPHRDGIPAPRRLITLLSVMFVAGVGTGCVIEETYKVLSCVATFFTACGDDPEENKPAADCISSVGGTDLCGPPWDRDNDTISTATETNATNKTANGGFYNFDVAKWDTNHSQARGTATNGTLYRGMNLTNSETGYMHYDFCEGNADVDDWGTGHLVRLIEAAGRAWVPLRTLPVRVQVGDLSLKLGDYFPGQPGVTGCEADHTYRAWTLTSDT